MGNRRSAHSTRASPPYVENLSLVFQINAARERQQSCQKRVSRGRGFRDVGRVPRTLARRQQGSLDASRAESGGLIIPITPDFALLHLADLL
jgi:hypothetical protein